MNDSTPLIPWQHKEFYSIEPMTNQDLDVHCFPTEDGRGREIEDSRGREIKDRTYSN